MTIHRILSLGAASMVVVATTSWAGEPPSPEPGASPSASAYTEDDLFRFLEDEIEVTTASQLKTKIAEAPQAVYVITREEIARSTAINIADLLRHVPGLIAVNATHSQWAVGMNVPWALNVSTLLVLVDGRAIYSPFANTNEWWSLPFAPDDIEQIEVVLGPSTTVHGSQALFGVINFITRDLDEEGASGRVAAGGNHGADLEARFGDLTTYGSGTVHLGPMKMRGAAGYERLEPWDDPDLYQDGRALAQPTAQRGFGNLHLDLDLGEDTELRFRTGATAHEGAFVSFGPGFRQGFSGFADAELVLGKLFGDEDQLTLRTYYRYNRFWTAAPLHPLVPLIPMDLNDHATLVRALYTTPLPLDNRLATAIEVRVDHTDLPLLTGGSGTYSYYSIFVQDELRALEPLILSGGVRLETQYREGLDFTERLAVTPQVSLVWLPWEGHALRLSYGQATNYQGSFYELGHATLFDGRLLVYEGLADTTRDPMHTWEVGYRGQLLPSLLVTLSYAARLILDRFWLVTGDGALLPVVTERFPGDETRHSLDVTASWRPSTQLRLDGAFSWIIANDQSAEYAARVGDEPKWLLSARAHLSPHERVELDLDLKCVAERTARSMITGEAIPVAGWLYLNARLAYRFMDDPDLEVYGIATNLTDTKFGEGVTTELADAGVSRVGRRFLIGLAAEL